MLVSIGTFNLNNLFSRWNFAAAVDELPDSAAVTALTVRYEFTSEDSYRLRTFRGRLVRAKDPADSLRIAERIDDIDVDVLAVQEVENIETLRDFNSTHLAKPYRHVALIEGNDPRFIDVGLLSRYPLGAITSHQAAVHSSQPAERVFGRDLLEVEVLNDTRRRRLLTVYVNHLKSKFVPFGQDPVVVGPANDARRRRQAESVARIVGQRQRPSGRFVVLGDMNDSPEAETLAPMLRIEGRIMVDGLAAPTETRAAPADRSGPGPMSSRWTHRFKPSRQQAQYALLDQIWLSDSLAARQAGSFIDRRTKLTHDGSDHDPAWVVLDV